MCHRPFHRWRKIPIQGRLQAELVQVRGQRLILEDREMGFLNEPFPIMTVCPVGLYNLEAPCLQNAHLGADKRHVCNHVLVVRLFRCT